MPPASEIGREEVERMAEVLGINAPVQETAEERRQWVAWWKLSYEAALTLHDDERAYLKSGGWWPPLRASMIGVAPEIVRRTARPGLFAD
ncbi:MAG: hypothetical protein ACLP4V_17035 [Methylocella sp.]